MKAETTYGKVLGVILLRMRKDKFLKSAEIAEKLGVSVSAWSRIERGEGDISAEQLRDFARIFRKNPGDILNEADKACERLRKEGIRVHDKKSQKKATGSKWGLALLGLGVLSAIVSTALADTDDAPPEKNKK